MDCSECLFSIVSSGMYGKPRVSQINVVLFRYVTLLVASLLGESPYLFRIDQRTATPALPIIPTVRPTLGHVDCAWIALWCRANSTL